MYEEMNEYQKINHFPNSFELTRKDKMCENIVKLQKKFSQDEFGFIPETYILPEEYNLFISIANKNNGLSKTEYWIMKPFNLSRGRGIHIFNNIEKVDPNEPMIISRYITNPLLLNGLKFDLRIYVVVTCLDPLRIFIYNEGLARFATEKYCLKNSKLIKFIHLTNYSVNKKNKNFVQNTNAYEDDKGSKWSLSALFNQLNKIGIDTSLLWSRIYDIIIKSIISSLPQMLKAFSDYSRYRSSCFELFGYDILIDSELKPWLMEINLTPSLACESPIDFVLKSHLISDMFNLVGIKQYERRNNFHFIKQINTKPLYRPCSSSISKMGTYSNIEKALQVKFNRA